jgi:hypothetical protein
MLVVSKGGHVFSVPLIGKPGLLPWVHIPTKPA